MAEIIYLIMIDSSDNEKVLIKDYNKLYPSLQIQEENWENSIEINERLYQELGFTYLMNKEIEESGNQYEVSFLNHKSFTYNKILSFRLNKFYDLDKAYFHIFRIIFYLLEEYPMEAVITSELFDDIGYSDGDGNLFLKKDLGIIDLTLLEQSQRLKIEFVEDNNEEEDGSYQDGLSEDEGNESFPIDIRVIDEADMKYFSDFIPPQFFQIPPGREITFLGILQGKFAIGAMIMEQAKNIINIHWIYIMPEYRRFHYASQAIRQLQEKTPLLNAQSIHGELCGTVNEMAEMNQFFIYNHFTVHSVEYPVYHIYLKKLLEYPAFQKIADKKTASVIPLAQVSNGAIKRWNQENQKVKYYTKYPDCSFVSVSGNEIKGVVSGCQESDDTFILKWVEGDTPGRVLDLILTFVRNIEKYDENICMKWFAHNAKTEQLIQYLTGETGTSEKIAVSYYEYLV